MRLTVLIVPKETHEYRLPGASKYADYETEARPRDLRRPGGGHARRVLHLFSAGLIPEDESHAPVPRAGAFVSGGAGPFHVHRQERNHASSRPEAHPRRPLAASIIVLGAGATQALASPSQTTSRRACFTHEEEACEAQCLSQNQYVYSCTAYASYVTCRCY